MTRSRYIILIKSWKGLDLLSNLQHWAKNMLETFIIQSTSIWPNFILIVLRIQKNKHKCNFHYVAMPMMMSQILKCVDFTKTQKPRYIENKTFFFSNKKSLIADQELLYCKKSFCNRGKAVARRSFVKKVQADANNFIKKQTLAQVFPCEFCEISKKTFSYRTPPVAASLKGYTVKLTGLFLCPLKVFAPFWCFQGV